MTEIAFALGLGSNLGTKESNIHNAFKRLQLAGLKDLKLSSLIHSDPVDCANGAPDFINAAITGKTILSADALLNLCMTVEEEMGRPKHREYHADRVIDLDILLYGSETIMTDKLIIPHPYMHERDFVLEPLAELASDWQIPGIGTVSTCLSILDKNNDKPLNIV